MSSKTPYPALPATPWTLSEAGRALAGREAQALLDKVEGVTAVVVAGIDGCDIAFATRGDADPARIAAMASSISAIGAVVSQEVALGRTLSVTIDTEAGFALFHCVHRSEGELIVNVVASTAKVLARVRRRVARMARALADA